MITNRLRIREFPCLSFFSFPFFFFFLFVVLGGQKVSDAKLTSFNKAYRGDANVIFNTRYQGMRQTLCQTRLFLNRKFCALDYSAGGIPSCLCRQINKRYGSTTRPKNMFQISKLSIFGMTESLLKSVLDDFLKLFVHVNFFNICNLCKRVP